MKIPRILFSILMQRHHCGKHRETRDAIGSNDRFGCNERRRSRSERQLCPLLEVDRLMRADNGDDYFITRRRLPSGNAKVVPFIEGMSRTWRRNSSERQQQRQQGSGHTVPGSKDLVRPGPWKSRKWAVQWFLACPRDGAGCIVKKRFAQASTRFKDLSNCSIHFANYPCTH